MWLPQKNLPAIVVVVVYAKQITALGGESKKKKKKRKHTAFPFAVFHKLINNAEGDGLETPRPVIFFSPLPLKITFHAPCLPQPFKWCFCRAAC